MFEQRNWREYVDLAANYKAIGQTDIYLMRDEDVPWECVTLCEPGSTYRLSIPVSTSFMANHLASGLQFHWTFDLEKKGSNGNHDYHIDVPRIVNVLARLPEIVARQFREQLKTTAVAVRKQAEEYRRVADDQYQIARELETI